MRITPAKFKALYDAAKAADTEMVVDIGGALFTVDRDDDHDGFFLVGGLDVVQVDGKATWEYYSLSTVEAVAKTLRMDDPNYNRDGDVEAERVHRLWYPEEG